MTATATTPDAPTRLTLIRHGESVVTVNRVIGGTRSCTGLSPLGRRQSERLRDRLDGSDEIDADLLIASDFPRAIETAEIVQPALGAPVADLAFERLAGFGEHDPGPDIDGMTFVDYVEKFGSPDWSSDPDAEVFPGGETIAEFHARVVAALDSLLADNPGRSIVVACHGGVVEAVFRRLLELPITGAFELQTSNTSLTEFQSTSNGRWRLVRYNDAAHLAGLPAATARQ